MAEFNNRMKDKVMLDIIERCWPIFVAIVGFVVYKFVPYLQTKIFEYKHYNTEMSFVLMEYELLCSLAVLLIAAITAVICGKSTLQELYSKEYIISWSIITGMYLMGIYVIVKRKNQRGKRKYIKNMMGGFLVHIALSLQLWMMIKEDYDERADVFVYVWVFGVLILQFMTNHVEVKIKDVKYIVYTEKESFDTEYEPVKRGKYYFVRTKNMNNEKRIQLPEDKIVKIEYLIQNLEENPN